MRGSSTAAVAAVTAASAAASVAMALDVTRVDELLTTGRLGRRFHYCEEIDSTMTWAAKAMAEADDPLDLSGSVFVAEIQTAGIGRRGRVRSGLIFDCWFCPGRPNDLCPCPRVASLI